MPSTPINIYDLSANRREIRKNFSDQIISYTLPSDSNLEYGLKRIPAKTVFYQTEKYNDVIDLTSDELINDISDLQPTVVSNNFVDLDLVLSDAEIQQQQQQASIVSIRIYSDGNDARLLDPNTAWVLPGAIVNNRYKFSWVETINPVVVPFTGYENVISPYNFENSIDLYYYSPIQLGTQLYTNSSNGVLSQPYVPFFQNNDSVSAIASFDESIDTNFRDLLNDSPTVNNGILNQIRSDIQNNGYPRGFLQPFLPYKDAIDKAVGEYSKDFIGAYIKVDNDGKVLEIKKIVGDYGNQSNNKLRYEAII